MQKLLPIILAGGSGARLWPLSRKNHPKQFIKLSDGDSLLQKTYKRACELTSVEEVVVVTNRDLFFYSKDECEEASNSSVSITFISEPVGKDSCAAFALAAHHAFEKYGADCLLLILPADHQIQDVKALKLAINDANQLANLGNIVTFGVKPSRPESGFGYILADGNSVIRFVEKPSAEKANEYIAHGGYFWNSGIFCVSAANFISEMLLYVADIEVSTKNAFKNAKRSSGPNWTHLEVQRADFEQVQSISVDYAVLEKSNNVAMVQLDLGWSDIGSWTELGAMEPKDKSGNRIVGDAICHDTEDSVIYGGSRLIATLGIKDLIIADTADATLIVHKDHVQKVRGLFDELEKKEHPTYLEFPTVHRPWGSYTILQEDVGFKVKRIEVKANARLSLQSHEYRSEHWVVVSGTAAVINGQRLFELKENETTFIPIGNQHRLHNPGAETLVIIEIQYGDYLGEDDIVRYDDQYGRTNS